MLVEEADMLEWDKEELEDRYNNDFELVVD
jgi:hypothetical protein